MDATTIEVYANIVDILVKITVIIGAAWGIYKYRQHRELNQRIQLEIDADIYKLTSPEQAESFTWDRKGNRIAIPSQKLTHVIDIRLRFTNKGFVRMRLFNIQIGVNTMRPGNEVKFDKDDGHLHLQRIFTSGNIVPIFPVENKQAEDTSFYYIEPGIEQTISYLALISEPRELVQVQGKFSLEQKRIFPFKDKGEKELYPHTAVRTYKLDCDGMVIRCID
jgi:hypothetical protein